MTRPPLLILMFWHTVLVIEETATVYGPEYIYVEETA